MESKKYYWTDLESGVTFECSKEFRDSMLNTWEAAKPKFLGKPFGKVIITGTVVGIGKSEDQLMHEYKGIHHDNPMDSKWIDKKQE